MGSLAQLCQRCPTSCNGTFEATDLTRLVDLSEEWSRRDHHHHASPLQQPHQERLSSRVSHALGLTRRIEAIRASGIRTSYRGAAEVSPGLPDSFFQQAVKKVLGVAHLRCRRVWVVDSESVPFRPFSMRAIFDEYWQDPVVYTATGSTGLEQLTSRQEYLYNQSLALLGIPQGTDWNTTTLHGGPESYPLYRHGDYWHWDAQLMRSAMTRAIRVFGGDGSSPPSFVRAFLATPAHELLYYTHAHWLVSHESAHRTSSEANHPAQARHRFVAASYIERDLFGARAVWKPPCASQSNHADLFVWSKLMRDDLELACRLMTAIGYHGYRYQPHGRGNACFSWSSHQWVARLAGACGRDGRMHNASVERFSPAFEWWLCQDKVVASEWVAGPNRPANLSGVSMNSILTAPPSDANLSAPIWSRMARGPRSCGHARPTGWRARPANTSASLRERGWWWASGEKCDLAPNARAAPASPSSDRRRAGDDFH